MHMLREMSRCLACAKELVPEYGFIPAHCGDQQSIGVANRSAVCPHACRILARHKCSKGIQGFYGKTLAIALLVSQTLCPHCRSDRLLCCVTLVISAKQIHPARVRHILRVCATLRQLNLLAYKISKVYQQKPSHPCPGVWAFERARGRCMCLVMPCKQGNPRLC